MKATLEFQIDNFDDALAHKQALAGKDALLALHEMDDRLRNAAKYHDDKEAERWREILFEVLGIYGLNLEDLVP